MIEYSSHSQPAAIFAATQIEIYSKMYGTYIIYNHYHHTLQVAAGDGSMVVSHVGTLVKLMR